MVATPGKLFDKAKRQELLNQGNIPFPSNNIPPPQQRRQRAPISPTGPPLMGMPLNMASGKQNQIPPRGMIPPTHRRVTSADLAKQYDFEKQNIIKSCFSKVDPDGSLHESYISHVRIIEDSHYPSNAPAPGVKSTGHLKPRVLLLGVKKSGRVRIHKGRENTDGTFQIGRTWDLDELSKIEQLPNPCGLILLLGKAYYWQTNSPMERFVFVKTLLSTFVKYTGGKYPEMINVENSQLNVTRTNSMKSSTSSGKVTPVLTDAPALPSVRSSSTKKGSSSTSAQSPPTVQEKLNNYNNIDFTAQGQLPMKPMVPLDVSRPDIDATSNANIIKTPVKAKPSPIIIPPNIKSNIPIVKNTQPNPVSTSASIGQSTSSSLASPMESDVAPLNISRNNRESTNTKNTTISSDFSSRKASLAQYEPTSGYSSRKGSVQYDHMSNANGQSINNTFQESVHKAKGDATPQKSPPYKSSSITKDKKRESPMHPYKQFSSPLANRDEDSSIEEIDEVEFKVASNIIPDITKSASDGKGRDVQSNTISEESIPSKSIEEPAATQDGKGANRLRGIALQIMKRQHAMQAFNKNEATPDDVLRDVAAENGLHAPLAIENMNLMPPASPDLEIEEVSDSDNEAAQIRAQKEARKLKKKLSKTSENEPKIGNDFDRSFTSDFVEEQRYDVESYDSRGILPKDSNSGEGLKIASKSIKQSDSKSGSGQNGIEEDSNVSSTNIETKSKSDPKYLYERKTDMEELFDEIHWTSGDTAETLIEKLNKELNKLKYENVTELINFNFKLDSAENEVGNSMKEVNELNVNLMNLNLDFRLISQEITSIENDSEGLQVQSINKKHLYNDLKEILNMVDMDTKDLKFIQKYQDFSNVSQLSLLEQKLALLYNAVRTIRSDDNGKKNEDLSSMEALKQYQQNYEIITASFVKNFTSFIQSVLSNLIDKLDKNISAFDTSNLETELNQLLIYSGFIYFINDITNEEGANNVLSYFLRRSSNFFESLLQENLKNVSSPKTNFDLNVDENDSEGASGLKKSRTLRFTDRKDRIKEKLGSMVDITGGSIHSGHLHSATSVPSSRSSTKDYVPENIDAVIDIIFETRDIIVVEQNFLVKFFHSNSESMAYPEYIKTYPVHKISEMLQAKEVTTNSFSTDLMTYMSSIFDGYLDSFLKEVVPNTTNLPLLLINLEKAGKDYQSSDQEYLNSKFIKKVSDRFRFSWNRFIENQISILEKLTVVNKSGVMKSMKNFNLLIFMIETSLKSSVTDLRTTSVRSLLNDSYQKLSEAVINMLMKNDPLLKDTEFDEKQRLYHNVSLVQNFYYLSEELNDFSIQSLIAIKSRFRKILATQLKSYFSKILAKPLGKLIEFIENIESLTKENISINVSKSKVYNKSSTKKLLANYDLKEIRLRVELLYKKLEKHYLATNNDYETKLVNKLWADLRNEFIDIFTRLNFILSNYYKDIDYHVGKQDIIATFSSVTH